MSKNRAALISLFIFSLIVFICSCFSLKARPDRMVGAAFCHQLPDRSPAFRFPFCYRCSGLFFGIFHGMFISALIGSDKKLFSKQMLICFVLSILLYITDILNSSKFPEIRIYPESVNYRFLSAYPLGFFTAATISRIIFYIIPITTYKKKLTGFAFPLLFFICWGLSYLMIFNHSYVLSLISRTLLSFAGFVFLSCLYAIFIKCMAMLRNFQGSPVVFFMTGSSCALLQITFLGYIHLRFLPFDQIL